MAQSTASNILDGGQPSDSLQQCMLGSVVSSLKALCMTPTGPKGLGAKRESTGGFAGGIVASEIWPGLEGPWEGTYWSVNSTPSKVIRLGS